MQTARQRDRLYRALKRIDAWHAAAAARPALTAPLRLASFAAYRGLELLLGRRHPHERVVARARDLARTAAPAPHAGIGAGRHVLFFTVRGWFVHAATDALLAKAVQQRGASASVFLCGGGPSQCDFKPASDPLVTKPLCRRCQGFPSRLAEAFVLPVRTLADLGVDAAAAAARVRDLSREELEALTHRGLPILRLCLPSIHRSLLRGDPGEGPLAERVLRGYVAAGLLWADACERLLDLEKPDVVVATNGLFHAERIMLELARRRGIRVVTTERGWRKETLFLDREHPAARFETGRHWDAVRDRPLRADENERLDAYLRERAGGGGGIEHLWPAMDADRAGLARRLGIDPDRPVAVLFSNILWDTAIFERDAGFRGMFDWICETVRVFERNPETQLLIRIHPAEIRLIMSESRDRVSDRLARAFPTLPANVRVVSSEDPASPYALTELASAVLVYTSTVGLEAALQGRPVVLAGTPHYRGRGFTRDVARRADYEAEVLSALREGSLHPDAVERARRYANLLFFELMHPFPYVTDQPRGARDLNLASLADLAPGRDPVLDRLCAAILEGSSPR